MSRIGAEGEPRLNPTLFPDKKNTNAAKRAGMFTAGVAIAFTGYGYAISSTIEGLGKIGKIINGNIDPVDHVIDLAKIAAGASIGAMGLGMVDRSLEEPEGRVKLNRLRSQAQRNRLVQEVSSNTLSGMGTIGVRTG